MTGLRRLANPEQVLLPAGAATRERVTRLIRPVIGRSSPWSLAGRDGAGGIGRTPADVCFSS